jgi:tRNA 2-thiouridine synthesizing protein A
MAETPVTRQLDTRGSYCPRPLIDTDNAMRALAAGEVLEVLADDIGVKLDLPAWCRAHRQRLIAVEQEGRLIRVLIMKVGDSA